MKNNSYLLALDGSVEARAAAFLAWNLAKITGARVDAQHVINVRDTWRFLRPKSAGFIGSGPYMEEFRRVSDGLRSVGEKLMGSYRAQVEGQNIDFSSHLDEGDLVTEICKRARLHDLLIIGHRRSPRAVQLGDYSLCEELAGICPSPMLVVTASCDQWNKMCIHIEDTNVDLRAIETLSRFAHKLALSMKLHISSSITLSEVKALLNALSICNGFKSWEIYMDNGKQDKAAADELRVILPVLNERAVNVVKSLRASIHELSEPALLVWPQKMAGKEMLTNRLSRA